MTERICGKCELAVNDIEPVRCGLCERFFHNILDCCGFNSKPNKDLFKCGKAMYFCEECRNELAGRSMRAYLDARTASFAQSPEFTNLASQIIKLNDVVAKLGGKVDSLASKQPTPSTKKQYASVVAEGGPPAGKRRRSDSEQPARVGSCKQGTKALVFNNLSIANLIATPPAPRFWLYLAGFNPLVTDDDIGIIVSQCLELTEPPEDIRRLVPKEANTSRYTFVSFKVGLDPALSEKALSDVWPEGIRYREFEDAGSKNFSTQAPNGNTPGSSTSNTNSAM